MVRKSRCFAIGDLEASHSWQSLPRYQQLQKSMSRKHQLRYGSLIINDSDYRGHMQFEQCHALFVRDTDRHQQILLPLILMPQWDYPDRHVGVLTQLYEVTPNPAGCINEMVWMCEQGNTAVSTLAGHGALSILCRVLNHWVYPIWLPCVVILFVYIHISITAQITAITSKQHDRHILLIPKPTVAARAAYQVSGPETLCIEQRL